MVRPAAMHCLKQLLKCRARDGLTLPAHQGKDSLFAKRPRLTQKGDPRTLWQIFFRFCRSLRFFLICPLLQIQRFVNDALKNISDALIVERPFVLQRQPLQHLLFAVVIAQSDIIERLYRPEPERDLGPPVQQFEQLAVDRVYLAARFCTISSFFFIFASFLLPGSKKAVDPFG